jgi:hypothetical protein
MSKAKHTMGPWVAIVPKSRLNHLGNDITQYTIMTDKTRGELRRGGAAHYKDDPHDVDNITIASQFLGDMTLAEGQANASLIAAAPDLLQALENFLAFAENEAWSGELLNNASAAISKAKGVE